jgi:diphthamide synthase (EF-2-diphthine--ammonia ligase)
MQFNVNGRNHVAELRVDMIVRVLNMKVLHILFWMDEQSVVNDTCQNMLSMFIICVLEQLNGVE